MKLSTRISLWYGGAMLAALLVLVAHAAFEIYQHSHGKEGAEDTELGEVIAVELAVGLPMLMGGLGVSWWLSRSTVAKLRQLTDAAAGLNAGNWVVNLPAASRAGDELDHLTEVFRDMTGRLRDSFAQTRDFTLHASHELKTPLAIMRGEVETAMKEVPPGGAPTAWMESLLEEIDRMARVVDSLAFLAKADAGQIPIREDSVDLSALVRDAAEDAQLLANPHGLTVECRTPQGPCLITGDRHRLRQLLLNLADNAVKYNQPGGFVRIALAAPPGEAVLEFANPGPGIPGELSGRVFERFFRVDPSRSQEIEGSGLGLHIAQWIVQRHGGTIALLTGKDGLTRVTVRLPTPRGRDLPG